MGEKEDKNYWVKVYEVAKELNSDGCTGVRDYYINCCYDHDIAYRTGKTIYGKPISKREADKRFRQCIQSRSKLGVFSPMSWWRWAAVSLFGRYKQ